MKKLYFSLFFVILFRSLQAVNYMPRYSIGLTFMPDYGGGVNFTAYHQHLGVYVSYAHNIPLYTSRKFDDSQKVSAGAMLLLYGRKTAYPFYLTAGYSYNTYEGLKSNDPKASQPFDLQLGWGMMLNEIAIGVRYDCIKKDASVDMKWNFGKKIIKYNYKKR